MTAFIAGAPSTAGGRWNRVNWDQVKKAVYRMQMRIAKSIRQKRYNKAKALQRLLSRSFAGRLWAVKRISKSMATVHSHCVVFISLNPTERDVR